jgi:L-aspartate oxidase
LPGLWVCGEVSSSGLHGANRLASNSLIEGLVFGALCGRGAMEAAAGKRQERIALSLSYSIQPPENNDQLDVADMTASLRALMVRKMGIVRERSRLLEAVQDVGFWCRYVLTREFDNREGWELQNLLVIARLMIDAAIKRNESRGTHFRSDFPARDDAHWGLRHNTSPRLEELIATIHI